MQNKISQNKDDEPIYTGNRVRTISEIQKEEQGRRKGKKGQHVELPKLPDEIREQIGALKIVDDRELEDFDVPDGAVNRNKRPIYEAKYTR